MSDGKEEPHQCLYCQGALLYSGWAVAGDGCGGGRAAAIAMAHGLWGQAHNGIEDGTVTVLGLLMNAALLPVRDANYSSLCAVGCGCSAET